MALTARKGSPTVERALVSGYNALRGSAAVAGSFYHKDVTSNATTGDFNTPATTARVAVSTSPTTTLAMVVTLANELQVVYNASLLDDVAHKVADVTNASTAPQAVATDQTAVNTLLNDIQTKFNLHCVSTTYHYTADTIDSTTAASSLATSKALADALKTKINAHINSSPAGSAVVLIEP